MVDPRIRLHLAPEVQRMGLEPVHIVHAMGESEGPTVSASTVTTTTWLRRGVVWSWSRSRRRDDSGRDT